MIHSSLLRFSAGLFIGLVLAPGIACHRDNHPQVDNRHATLPLAAAPNPSSSLKPAEPNRTALARHVAKGRVVAIGDIHGDLEAARRVLRVAKVVDDSDRWIGGDSVVVQTGDVLDRGNDERPLLEWLERLAVAAEQGGGMLYRVNGNHEIMNVAGDFRYVTEPGFAAFADYAAEPVPGPLRDAPASQRGRYVAFLPGGAWARRLAQYPVVLIVNDSIFTHGGLLPKHVEYGLERINSEVSSWMRGMGKLSSTVAGDDSPFWARTYGGDVAEADCAMLAGVLDTLNVKRLVVGHTPQKLGVTFACNERVARIDVGLSSYYGNNPASALEISTAGVKVLREVLMDKAPRPHSDHRRPERAANMQP